MSEELERLADEKVADLIEHWGSAYEIWRADEWFHAWARAGGPRMSAPSAEQLRTMIRADYLDRTGPKPTDQGSL